MFSRTEVAQLFPTCVWIHDLADAARINATMLAALDEARATEPSRAKGEGGWQSAGDLHQRPAFRALADAAVAAAAGVVRFLDWRCSGVAITDLWANVNFPGHAHRQHSHPNNFLSGVYYLQTPAGCGDLVFYDPRPQAHLLEPAVGRYTPQNSAKQRFPAQAGRMLLFPAWFEHSVDPNESDQDRVSIAFNLVLKGRIGRESGWIEI